MEYSSSVLTNIKYRHNNVAILAIIEYIFVLLLVLECNSVYQESLGILHVILHVAFLLMLVILCGYYLIMFKRERHYFSLVFNSFLIFYLIYIVIFLCLNYFVNHNYSFLHAIFIFVFVFPLFLLLGYLSFVLKRHLLVKIENIILILAIISLVFWVAWELHLPANSQLAIKWGGDHLVYGYYYLDFNTQGTTDFLGNEITRNTGIFAEAPIFSYILSLAFLIELFVEDNTSAINFKSILFLVVIFTTTSTTGLLVSIAALSYFYFVKYFSKVRTNKYFMILLLVLSLIIVGGIGIVLVSKWMTMQGSVSIRTNDFIAGYQAWLEHPIIGNGISNNSDEAIKHYMASFRLVDGGNSGVSSGLIRILADGGIMYLLVYLTPVLLAFKHGARLFGFALFNFILMIFTVVDNTYLYLFILAMLWVLVLTRVLVNQNDI